MSQPTHKNSNIRRHAEDASRIGHGINFGMGTRRGYHGIQCIVSID